MSMKVQTKVQANTTQTFTPVLQKPRTTLSDSYHIILQRRDHYEPIVQEPSQPVPGTRNFFDPHFRHDFSRVWVHTGKQAAEVARAVNALAFTVGQDVVFVKGEYAPDVIQGKRLLAHVLQQCTVMPQPGVDTAQSDDGIGYEDNVAKSVSQGKKLMPSAPLLVQRFPGQCDPFRPVDCFIQQFIGQIPQLIEEAIISQVERVCQWVIEVTVPMPSSSASAGRLVLA